MGFADIPMFLTPRQLSELTGEHEGSVRRGCVEGRIPADKVNGRWLICRDTVFSNTKEAIGDGRHRPFAGTPM